MKEYKPISCSFVDLIEHYATLKKPVEIVYDNDGHTVKLISIIKTWDNDGQAEYMLLEDNSEKIRLDKIISIDGKALSLYC